MSLKNKYDFADIIPQEHDVPERDWMNLVQYVVFGALILATVVELYWGHRALERVNELHVESGAVVMR